jgi:hypothetical protein
MKICAETERLILREITPSDLKSNEHYEVVIMK